MQRDESREFHAVRRAMAAPKIEQAQVRAYRRIAALERAFEPARAREGDEPLELGRGFVDLAAEIDARVAALGEPGVAHEREHFEPARAYRAMQRPGRELDVAPARERHRPEAVLEVVQLDGARPRDHVVGLVADRVDVGAAGHHGGG